jgi:hypothetical protein
VTTNDVSPYLQRPVRTLEEVMAEAAEQQRLEMRAELPLATTVLPAKPADVQLPVTSAPSKRDAAA